MPIFEWILINDVVVFIIEIGAYIHRVLIFSECLLSQIHGMLVYYMGLVVSMLMTMGDPIAYTYKVTWVFPCGSHIM